MTAASPTLLSFLDQHEGPTPQQLAAMLGLSVGLHLMLLLAMALRIPTPIERPRPSYDVSLVTLPSMTAPTPAVERMPTPAPVAQPRPIPPAPRPQPTPTKLAPTKIAPLPTLVAPQPAKRAIAPTIAPKVEMPPVVQPKAEPKPLPAPVVEAKRTPLNIKDLLKDVSLPPDAPKVGDIAPAEAPAKPVQRSAPQEIRKLVDDLAVPEAAAVTPATAPTPGRVRAPAPSAPALDPQLQRQLEQLQQPIASAPPAPPVVASKTPVTKHVQKIVAQDGGPGSNDYFALVQRLISQGWVPPKIGIAGDTFEVIIRFRLSRDGRVSEIAIDTPSGNGYYDDSARRAVLSARLPEFRPGMTASQLDVRFRFTVGETEQGG
ncbi:MAG TPA: TonB family protein [Nitrospirales bacterium]|nr:TonB family protein [Nitrospirales bacterium]